MRKQILTYFLIACTVFTVLDAALEVKVSKSIVGLNESFNLDIASRQQPQAQPDFSPLQENFEILSCGQSSSIKIMNNATTRENHWHLVLQPKSEGELTIPSIACGNEHSVPQKIQVTAPRIIKQDDSLILETEVTPKEAVFEQSQLIYTIKLYRSVNLSQAAFSEFKVNDSDAIIERLGNDTESEFMHPNGTRYILLERKYAVFPQREGELTFSPMIFDATVIKGGSSFLNVQTEHKRISSNAIKVQVKPIPAPFQKGDWFPANNVQLNEEWSADPNTMTAGEPITRTITLTAEGCTGNQIPAVALNFPNQLKHYLDKPEITNKTGAQGFVGVRQMKVALISSKAGEIVLPEVKVKWWDLKTNQERTAILPSKTLHVQEAAIAMNTTPLPKVDQIDTSQDLQSPSVGFSEELNLPGWAWGLIGLNSIWIFILFKAVFRKLLKTLPISAGKLTSSSDIKKEIKQACKLNDAKQAETKLLAWLIGIYPQVSPQSLAGIKPHLSIDLQEAIDELNEALYGHNKSWEGESLWQAVSSFTAKREPGQTNPKHSKHLKELY